MVLKRWRGRMLLWARLRRLSRWLFIISRLYIENRGSAGLAVIAESKVAVWSSVMPEGRFTLRVPLLIPLIDDD